MRYTAGLLTGRLFDEGHLRLPVFIASALFVVCMFLTAECTQYWQFLLCQGFGIGVSMLVPSVVCAPASAELTLYLC